MGHNIQTSSSVQDKRLQRQHKAETTLPSTEAFKSRCIAGPWSSLHPHLQQIEALYHTSTWYWLPLCQDGVFKVGCSSGLTYLSRILLSESRSSGQRTSTDPWPAGHQYDHPTTSVIGFLLGSNLPRNMLTEVLFSEPVTIPLPLGTLPIYMASSRLQ